MGELESLTRERDHLYQLVMEAPIAIAILRGPKLVFEIVNEHFERIFGGRKLQGLPQSAIDPAGEHVENLRAVCRSKHLTSLTNLRLRLTDFGDKGAEEIVSSGILKRLKVLDLQGGCMTDEGAEVLAGSPDLKNLKHLNLRANALKKTGKDLIKATGVRADLTLQHNMETGEFSDGELPDYLFDGDYE